MIADTVTSRLKALRVAAGLSIRDIAARLGMSSSGYLHYESPDRFKDAYLPMAIAKQIAAVLRPLGIDPAEVMALANDGVNPSAPIATAAGFSEGDASAWVSQDPGGQRAIMRALAPGAGNPASFKVSRAIPGFGLLAGDILIIDQRRLPDPGDIALANARDKNGHMTTVIGRFLPPMIVTADTLTNGKTYNTETDDIALYHPIIATYRMMSDS